MAGWQAWLRSLLMLYVCLFNMAIPFWHELDVEEHDVSHLDCHVKDATHLHDWPVAFKTVACRSCLDDSK